MIIIPWIKIHGYNVGHTYGIFSNHAQSLFHGLKSMATMSVVPMVFFESYIIIFYGLKSTATMSVVPMVFFESCIIVFPWIKIHGYNVGHTYGILRIVHNRFSMD